MAGPLRTWPVFVAAAVLFLPASIRAQDKDEPLNPFGSEGNAQTKRDDALPGYLEMSDGSVHPGQIFLTRDAKLKIFDEKLKQHREVPPRVIKRVDCVVLKEWDEKEWRFKENANDEKYFTGHAYPSRECAYKITLNDGRTIQGGLDAIVYVQGDDDGEPVRFILHKRDKGPLDASLKSLLYVKTVVFGAKALEEGKLKASRADDAAKKAAASESKKKAATSSQSRSKK